MLLLLLNLAAGAQSQRVVIKTLDDEGVTLGHSFIKLVPSADSSKQVQDIADSNGVAIFQLQVYQKYRTEVRSTAFEFEDRQFTVAPDMDTVIVRAKAIANKLNEVNITYTKPLMRQEGDKTIVDPEEIAASSTNVFEMMEQVPALFIDQDGNIYLNSMTPAKVFINGREQKMSAEDIAGMLRNLPPNAVERIEIMRTPSARYDASGTGGIVNVVLKKGVRIGLNGSINAGFNQGTYGNQYLGLSINNSNGPTSTYLNLNYSRQKSWSRISTDRQFTPDSILTQEAYTVSPEHSYYIGYGIGHELSKKWDLNYDGRLNLAYADNNTTNPSAIRNTQTNELVSSNSATITNDIERYNINQGLTLKYRPDTMGSEWVTDISYSYHPRQTKQLFTTVFDQPLAGTIEGEGDIDSRSHYFSAQTDYLRKLPNELQVEMGLKTTNIWFRNNSEYFNEMGGIRAKNHFRTRSYSYTEHIHAAYLQASKTFLGFTLKLGTRAENTNMYGRQRVPADTSFLQQRTDLFPYAYLSRKVMTIAGYELRAYMIYRRTIHRPSYEYLNPFPRYIDPYLFETGNPSLRPQFTQNYEANISVDERPLIAIGYNDTKDMFTQVIYQSELNRSLAYRTYDNLGTNKETYFRAMGAIPPGGAYFFVLGGQYNYNIYSGLYENQPLSFERGSWSFFTYHRLKITPKTRLSLSGFARFNGLAQFYELGPFGAINLSLHHKFFDDKLNVSISARDIFYTNNNEFVLDQGSIYATGTRIMDSRRFGLNLRYSFGLRKRNEEQNIFSIESPEKTGSGM